MRDEDYRLELMLFGMCLVSGAILKRAEPSDFQNAGLSAAVVQLKEALENPTATEAVKALLNRLGVEVVEDKLADAVAEQVRVNAKFRSERRFMRAKLAQCGLSKRAWLGEAADRQARRNSSVEKESESC